MVSATVQDGSAVSFKGFHTVARVICIDITNPNPDKAECGFVRVRVSMFPLRFVVGRSDFINDIHKPT